MLKRLWCKWFGHKRGKRGAVVDGEAEFTCPRCKDTWLRKVKVKPIS